MCTISVEYGKMLVSENNVMRLLSDLSTNSIGRYSRQGSPYWYSPPHIASKKDKKPRSIIMFKPASHSPSVTCSCEEHISSRSWVVELHISTQFNTAKHARLFQISRCHSSSFTSRCTQLGAVSPHGLILPCFYAHITVSSIPMVCDFDTHAIVTSTPMQ